MPCVAGSQVLVNTFAYTHLTSLVKDSRLYALICIEKGVLIAKLKIRGVLIYLEG